MDTDNGNPPVVFPIDDVIDLHTFLPGDIPSVVEEYLRVCADAGIGSVRIVHGKGTGAQRQRIRQILAQHPQVAEFRDAPPNAGGWGATVVTLKPAALRGDAGQS